MVESRLVQGLVLGALYQSAKDWRQVSNGLASVGGKIIVCPVRLYGSPKDCRVVKRDVQWSS